MLVTLRSLRVKSANKQKMHEVNSQVALILHGRLRIYESHIFELRIKT